MKNTKQNKTIKNEQEKKRRKTMCITVRLPHTLLRSFSASDRPDEGEILGKKDKDTVLNVQKANEESGRSRERHSPQQVSLSGPGDKSRVQIS